MELPVVPGLRMETRGSPSVVLFGSENAHDVLTVTQQSGTQNPFWLSDLCIYQTQGPGRVDSTPSPSPQAFGDKNGVLWGLLAGRPSRAVPASLGGLRPGLLESEGDAGCLTVAGWLWRWRRRSRQKVGGSRKGSPTPQS